MCARVTTSRAQHYRMSLLLCLSFLMAARYRADSLASMSLSTHALVSHIETAPQTMMDYRPLHPRVDLLTFASRPGAEEHLDDDATVRFGNRALLPGIVFFLNDPAPPEFSALPLHAPLPI